MLLAAIYKNPLYEGCSNNGISSRCDEVTIVNAEGPTKAPSDTAPGVILVARQSGFGNHPRILTFYPAVLIEGTWHQSPLWWMMGGSFIHTSDARFRELCDRLGVPSYGAVAFHDRHEG